MSELNSDWIYYLDEEQEQVLETVYEAVLKNVLDYRGYIRIHAIIGGPGTGKTSILVNLLKRFDDEGAGTVGLVASDSVLEYLEASTKMDISQHRCEWPLEDVAYDLVLLDDPSTLEILEHAANFGRGGKAKVIVLALDPLQLNHSVSDDRFNTLIRRCKIKLHTLSTCYRQKRIVGQATKHVMDTVARSTPYLKAEKKDQHWSEHEELTTLCNDLTFVNPFGYTAAHESATINDLKRELNALRKQKGGVWSHYYSLLVAIVDDTVTDLPSSWLHAIEDSGIDFLRVNANNLGSIKGVEFQHVFVVLKQSLYDQLNTGFGGSGRKTYDLRRLLRIPFSRAKDRLVVFVLT